MKEKRIIVEPHSETWLAEFAQVKAALEALLSDIPILSIEHVGSTSVPGLISKPVLDIDIVLTAPSLDLTRHALVQAGYADLGEMGVPGRFGFRQPGYAQGEGARGARGKFGEIRRNTYVCLEGSLALKNHRDLKRILMEDDALRIEYGAVKKRLVESGVEDIGEYGRGKNEIMHTILVKAGWSEEELEEVRKANT